MFYKLYIVSAGLPKPGLAPVFVSYQKVSDGTDVVPPLITEIDDNGNGNGHYKFSVAGVTEDLVGVVDADPGSVFGLSDIDRYIQVDITPDDFGLTDLLDRFIKGSETLDPDANTLTVKRRDGATTLVIFDVTKPLDLNKVIGPYIKREPQ